MSQMIINTPSDLVGWQSYPVAIGWRQLLGADDGCQLRPGAGPDEVAAAEAVLEAVFPAELKGLYLASDGVFDAPGQWFVIWPLEMLAEENVQRRRAGILPADLIAFGDDGTGDPFCVPQDGGDGVFFWDAIDGEATRLANSVATFWSGWVADTLPPH
jgi:hypothetical protein